MNTERRSFLLLLTSAAITSTASAAKKLEPTDPQAIELGYVRDASRVDPARHPRYTTGQKCEVCALFQARGGTQWGGCPLFSGEWVAAQGWCSAWTPRR